jgi:hypothetical protein
MRTRRPFTLGDLMGLVAAVALGISLDRWRVAETTAPPGVGRSGIRASHWISVLEFGRPSCYVVALALVLIPLRWIRPRPPASGVLRQPGAVACLATLGTIVANVALLNLGRAIQASTRRGSSPPVIFTHQYYWYWATEGIPLAILGTWVALRLGGRWSPEASWIDRAGRLVGFYWVATIFLGLLHGIIAHWLPYHG